MYCGEQTDGFINSEKCDKIFHPNYTYVIREGKMTVILVVIMCSEGIASLFIYAKVAATSSSNDTVVGWAIVALWRTFHFQSSRYEFCTRDIAAVGLSNILLLIILCPRFTSWVGTIQQSLKRLRYFLSKENTAF